ncbi:hypothetical protein [Streptomyces sp. DSM 40750]|uniref:hypothetical protein n=1 Tax=Streptomyces sp. DSM 40750 TaxID=2801030 RepID=UPI00214CBD2C|nr:hypothetical protein [Streptomyces sp. DSM 40750]UUU18914.1 hypothetical protein JIX55_00265 [Streptomyces sp. DSM 40750]UUU27744.1 hypothetical protein JIX55_50485 [Streptomyces sp. DSM 40750]
MSRLTADPHLDGWLRDLDIAQRRFTGSGDISGALQELGRQLEMGSEVAEVATFMRTDSRCSPLREAPQDTEDSNAA